MHSAGRSVPADVSIVGFNDTPFALYCSPPLTTVRQDFVALGRLCFARLLALLDPSSTDQWPPCLHNPGENEQRFRANPNTLPVHSEQASG